MHALHLSIRRVGIEAGQYFITKLLLFSHATMMSNVPPHDFHLMGSVVDNLIDKRPMLGTQVLTPRPNRR